MTDLRIAIAGFGLAGEVFHAPLIAATPGLSVAAVATSNPVRAARARAQYPGVAVAAGAEELLANADHIDALVVATPNRLHVPIARAALHRGLPVIVDKPLAPDAGQAQALVDDFAAAGVPLTVFQNRRWDGDFLTVRRVIGSGSLGTVTRLESRFERFRPQIKEGWREHGDPSLGGGVLLDLGPHLVDQAVQLFGPPKSVYSEVRTRREGALVDDDAFVALTHAGGEISHVWMSAVAPLHGPRLRVSGMQAGFACDGLDPQEDQLRDGMQPGDPGFGEGAAGLIRADDGAGKPLALETGAYVRFYEAVRDWARGEGAAPVDPWDGVRVLEILETARDSSPDEV
jgi:predicted dehydrogenase